MQAARTIVFWTTGGAKSGSVVTKALQSFETKPSHRTEIFNGNLYTPQPGELVLAMGKDVMLTMQSAGIVAKKRTVASCRGKVFKQPTAANDNDGQYMATYDPELMKFDASMGAEINWDIRLAERYARTNQLLPEVGVYRWVDDFSELISAINCTYEKTGEQVDVAGDTETLGKQPFDGAPLIAIGFTDRAKAADCLYVSDIKTEEHAKRVMEQVEFLLRSPKIKMRGANWKFDMMWFGVAWKLECINHAFDTLLAGSLVDENRSNSLNNHAKIYTTMGGYDDCVTADTRVLTDDLRWVPIGSIVAGDGLMAFDEHITGFRLRRKMRVATAESTKRVLRNGVAVTFSNGVKIRCSEDHGFVAHAYKSNGPFTWVKAKDLRQDVRVMNIAPVTAMNDNREAGYLAGLYDGEGYVSMCGDGLTSGISQKPGLVWNRYIKGVTDLGYGGFYSRQKNSDGVHTSKHNGWDTLKLLQELRPERLLAKTPYVGRCVPSSAPKITVERVEPIGQIEVVSLQTSTHTFVTEGVASHNCFNAKYDKSRMDLVPKDEMLQYLGGDVDAVFRVADAIKQELLQSPPLTNFYINVLHPSSHTFGKIERRGMLVDRKKLEEMRVLLEGQHGNGGMLAALDKRAIALLPGRIRAKYADDLSLQRPALLKDYFFSPLGLNLKPRITTPKNGEPSTAKAHLSMFFDRPEAREMVEIMAERGSVAKMCGTYVKGFATFIRDDGYLHPSYMLAAGKLFDDDVDDSGTNTGRLSAKEPPAQTVPKRGKLAKMFRACFPAPHGYVIWSSDCMQGELKIAACLSGDEAMLAAYLQGLDLHAVTGASMMDMEYGEFVALSADVHNKAAMDVFELGRYKAKASNFGLLYAMGAAGFVRYAWSTFKMILTEAEAQVIIDKFFAKYPTLLKWHERYIALAHRDGYVVSPLGRVRHLPLIHSTDWKVKGLAERQAINAPVQSTLSDLTCMALNQIEIAVPDAGAMAMIHDAALGYCPEDNAEAIGRRIVEIASNLPLKKMFGWDHQLQFTFDLEQGPHMGDMTKVKMAA